MRKAGQPVLSPLFNPGHSSVTSLRMMVCKPQVENPGLLGQLRGLQRRGMAPAACLLDLLVCEMGIMDEEVGLSTKVHQTLPVLGRKNPQLIVI